ncbi:unnamed protein product, partial [marine sediment metagenome]
LFKDSKYAERYVIGKKEIIENAPYDAFRRFYKDWYRPDLMAVIAVGDIDKSKVEFLIKKHFSNLTNPVNKRERIKYPIPENEGTLFAIASDKETTMSRTAIYTKHISKPVQTVADLRYSTIERLFSSLLSARIRELTQKPDAPFVMGFANKGRFLGPLDIFNLGAFAVKDNRVEQCLDVLLTEYEKAKRYGFSESELERQKVSMLRSYEKSFKEMDKTESRRLASEFIRNFLQDEFIPGIEYEYEFLKKYSPNINIEEVNKLASTLMTDDNRIVLINMPEKEGLTVPTEDLLRSVFENVKSKEITPYKDEVSEKPLLSVQPKPSPVVNEKEIKEIGVTEWTLQNGVKVILKPTDFKNDEILFTSYSPGGTSLVSDNEYISASNASSIISQSGLAEYNL